MELTVTTMITTYNHERFIAQALESAIAQRGNFTHKILVSDDASTDGTRQIIREYVQRYPELIQDISNDTNIGISRNMRKCFEMAKGKYLAVLEGDDYWTDPKKLEKQVGFLESNPDCSMVFSRIRLMTDGKPSLLPRHDALPKKIDYGILVGLQDMNPICNFSCCLFRTELMRLIPEVAYEYRLSEVTVAFFLAQLGPLGYMKECLSDYRIHEQGVFAGCDMKKKMIQALQTFETARKVADFGCWPCLDAFIENIKRSVYGIRPAGTPRLSIVTVTYNNLDGLRRTAESIAKQTWTDYEWIVMDGGSTDGSRDFLETVKPQPYHWVSQRDNGIYDAMNRGIEKARGEYVICMNAGDEFRAPDTLKKVFEAAPTADVVYGDWVRKYKLHEELCQAPKKLPPFYFFMQGCNICHQAMFVRTPLLQESKFDTGYFIAADWSKWRHFMVQGKTFQYIPVVVCTFEATEGVSNRQTYRNVLDGIRLQTDFPVGVMRQAAELRSYMGATEDRMKAQECSRRIYRYGSRAFWFIRKFKGGIKCLEGNGFRYTWKNFCGKVSRYREARRRASAS